MAKKPPKPPAGYTPSANPRHNPTRPAGKAAPAASPVPTGPSSNAIKQMQQALLNLAGVMSQNYLMKVEVATNPTKNSDPFGNFLVNQYINNEDVVGKQFVNVDVREPVRSNTAMNNKNLRGVISTLSRLGSPGKERQTDGIWQTRTDNALKQAVAVASALVQLSKDMGLTVEGYSDKDRDVLLANVPESYTQLGNTAATRAEAIALNLQKLANFYKAFENAVLNNDKYKAFITQQKPFTTYGKGEQLSQEESDFLKQNMAQAIPNVNFNGKAVTLGDISSPEAFRKFLAANNIQANNTSMFMKNLKTIKDAIETGYDDKRGF